MGDSAGGGLSLSLTLRLVDDFYRTGKRTKNMSLLILFLLLFSLPYPMSRDPFPEAYIYMYIYIFFNIYAPYYLYF